MQISIIGTGYVGLVTGAVFADFGNIVTCVDINSSKIKSLKEAKIPFFEPRLEDIVKRNLSEKRLFFTSDYSFGVPKAQAVFICVGTPKKQNGEADLKYVEEAIKETLKYIKDKTLIVIKSTVPVGADEDFEKLVPDNLINQIQFASCPEFLKEGSALQDAITPDRIVVGTTSEYAKKILEELYRPFNSKMLFTDLRSAQMIKYVSNSYLATKISFANMVANLCEKVGADVEDVLNGAGMDKRITRVFFNPGVGYGGSCFPKDVSAFISIFEEFKLDPSLFKAVEKINKEQIDLVIEKAEGILRNLKDKKVAILGLAFKPETDDLREAPSLKIISRLLEEGVKISAFDPVAMDNAKKILGDKVHYAGSAYEALADSDLGILVTEWNEFKELDFKKIATLMKNKAIIDGRNIYDPDTLKSLGFVYSGIGRN